MTTSPPSLLFSFNFPNKLLNRSFRSVYAKYICLSNETRVNLKGGGVESVAPPRNSYFPFNTVNSQDVQND